MTLDESRPGKDDKWKESSPARLINKSGDSNIKAVGISGRRKRFYSDLFTTLVDATWTWDVFIFSVSFVVTWLLFALYFWIVCRLHGDFDDNASVSPCISQVKSFVSTLLFSIETQSTIGYGYHHVTEECPLAYVGVFIQSIVGAGLQAALAGLVVAKVRRAKKRSRTILFSMVACIVEEDNQLKLITRAGDMRKSFIISVKLRGYFFQKISQTTGKSNPVKYHIIDFTGEGDNPQIFMAWPAYFVHAINKKSPLWKFSKERLYQDNFELVIILDGTVAATSMPFQATKSYLPWDILWGHRFETLGKKINKSEAHVFDFSSFHKTYAVPTPTCSACDLQTRINAGQTIPRPFTHRRPSKQDESDESPEGRWVNTHLTHSKINAAYSDSIQDVSARRRSSNISNN